MNRSGDGVWQCSSSGFKMSLALLTLAGLVALPAAAGTYGWGGVSSSDWSTPANWWGGSMALTGGTYDATIYVTNKANSALTYTSANGSTIYTSGTRCLRIGDNANGSMAITGGFLETRSTGDFVGNAAGFSGSLLIDGGTYVSTNGTFQLGANTGQGTLTVNSGSATLGTLNLWCSVSTVNLNGGILGLGGMSWTSGSASLNLNGGMLQVSKNTATWMVGVTNWICRLNAPTILDSQNFCATNAAPIIGSGTLTKIGPGLIALNVSNTVGAVTVNEGTLALGGSNTISSGVTLNAGGILNVNHAAALGSSAFTINGGRIGNTSGSTVINSLSGPINIYSNFTFLGSNDLNLGTGTVTLCNNLVVTNITRTLTFGGSVTNSGGNYALTVASNGTLAITGSLGIGGNVTLKGGALSLTGANTYTGTTSVGAGILYVAHSNALGSTNGTTDVSSGGKIQMMDGVAIGGETLYLAGGGDNWGAVQAAANSTSAWNGPIFLNELNPGGWVPRLGHKATGVLSVGGPIKPGLGGTGIHLWISGEPGSGRVIIASTNNTYTGITGIIRGTLALGADNALPVVTQIDMHPAIGVTVDYSKFDLNGFSQVVAKLFESSSVASRYVTNSSATASVLTVNQTATTTYSGRIDGNVGLVKDGTGSLTLAGTNTYSGATMLKNGTLALGCDGALSPATSLTISNATLNAGTWHNTVRQLTVTGAATINVGDGSCSLEFGDSSALAWTGTLNLVGSLGRNTIRFGTNGAGLAQSQIDSLRVSGQKERLQLSPLGYLIEIKGTLIGVY